MPMVKTFAWRSIGAAILAAALFACKEQVTAPGRCPELCPADSLDVIDTTFTGVITADTSIRGFTDIALSPVMVSAALDSLTAYTIVRFSSMPQKWFPGTVDTSGVTVGKIDSIVLDIRLDARDTNVNNTRVLVWQLPARMDSTWTFDSVNAFVQAPITDSIPVDDTLRTANLHRLLSVPVWTPLDVDSFQIAMAFGVRGDSATAATFLSSESGVTPTVKYYVHGAAPRDTFTISFTTVPVYDTYVRNPPAPIPPAGTIVVGNNPAARAFLQFDIPSYYVDSVFVSRATLHLQQLRPAVGLPGELVTVNARPILKYFGGKSLVIVDDALRGTGQTTAGTGGQFNIEVGPIIRLWHRQALDSLPRVMVLESAGETTSFGEITAAGTAGGVNQPRLTITYLRPFRFGVP